jgi:hypothetical protein
MLQRMQLREINCCETGSATATGRPAAIGQDFVYTWESVREAAMKRDINLDSFITMPIAARLVDKRLSSPVMFWYTPLNHLFVVTVCSKRKVDFMNPLHSLPGFAEYGRSFLRHHASPIVYWNGQTVFRIHAVDADTPAAHLVADFGNLFGLTVAESDAEFYEEFRGTPAEYFEYLSVPEAPEQHCNWNGKIFSIQHALCVMA